MSLSPAPTPAHARVVIEAGVAVLEVSGGWKITLPRPVFSPESLAGKPAVVRVKDAGIERWDTSLILWLSEVKKVAEAAGWKWEDDQLPAGIRTVQTQWAGAGAGEKTKDHRVGPLAMIGNATTNTWRIAREMQHFVGEAVLGALSVLRQPLRFRWMDCLWQMQQCGAMALPIVGLISFLVGVTLAYTGAIVLRQYGGDIYVADLVGLSMVREMGAMMTAIVLAGRTGAAFAAELANMKANEEVDALETFGLRPFNFLVMPRLAALGLMMPMLGVYANALGIAGGMIVAMSILNIPPTAYAVEMATIVGLSDIAIGMIKAATFGIIVGMAGCYHGLKAEPNAAGVGRAATSAVVTAILLVIVFDAIYAVLFNALGL